jgi:hypothetical protein
MYHKSWGGNSYLPSIFDYTKVPSSDDIAKCIYDSCSVSWDENHVVVFTVNVEGHLLWANLTTESDWKPLKKIMPSHRWYGTLKAISRGHGCVDVFCIGDNSTLIHLRFASESGWSLQHTFPSTWVTDPEVISSSPNRMDVFILGDHSGAYHVYFNDVKWSPWINLGCICRTAPKPVIQLPNRLNLFLIGTDGAL